VDSLEMLWLKAAEVTTRCLGEAMVAPGDRTKAGKAMGATMPPTTAVSAPPPTEAVIKTAKEVVKEAEEVKAVRVAKEAEDTKMAATRAHGRGGMSPTGGARI